MQRSNSFATSWNFNKKPTCWKLNLANLRTAVKLRQNQTGIAIADSRTVESIKLTEGDLTTDLRNRIRGWKK